MIEKKSREPSDVILLAPHQLGDLLCLILLLSPIESLFKMS